MFRFSIATVIGLSAALSAAHADTIIIQGTPSYAPAIVTHGDVAGLPDLSHSILGDPAFHRLARMCDTMGLSCGADHVTEDGGIDPAWTLGHHADAEKRLAQMIEDRNGYVTALEDRFDTLRRPYSNARPPQLFGWNLPRGGPHQMPPQFSHLFSLPPHIGGPSRDFRNVYPNAIPSVIAPQFRDLSGFNHRLNTPGAVIPHSLFPRQFLPRHTFPWRSH